MVQSSLLVAMDSEAQPLRRVVGTNIATIVAAAGFHGWTQLLPALVARLQSDHAAALDGALDALFKVRDCCFRCCSCCSTGTETT